MSSVTQQNTRVVLSYFDGCNTGEVSDLLPTLTSDVVHYFLPDRFKPIHGAEHLAKYWRKFKLLLNPTWKIDHIIAQQDEVVSEWSCLWTPEGTDQRLMFRGTEWYVMRGARISEVRAYFAFSEGHSTGLTGFPYGDRGYLGDAYARHFAGHSPA